MFSDWKDIEISDIASWPKSFKMFMAGLVCVAIVFIAYHFFAKPLIEQLEVVERKELQLREDFREKKALAINLDAYRLQMVEAEETFNVLLKQLPNQNEIPDLLVDVTQTGLSRGLQFEQFKPQPEQNQGFYTEKPVNIIVNGTYHQLAQFVSDVAALPRIVNVDNFKINSRDDGGLRMEAITKTYYYDEEGGADVEAVDNAQN